MLNQSKNLLGAKKGPQQNQTREITNDANNQVVDLASEEEEAPQSSQSKQNVSGNINPAKNVTENVDNSEIEMAEEAVEKEFSGAIRDDELIFSEDNTLDDYKKVYCKYMESDNYIDDDVIQDNFNRLSKQGRDTVWKILFEDTGIPTEDKQSKADALLNEIKSNCCFHNPWDYNDWVLLLRDELVKRNMKDFWTKFMVPNELGPCWAKDSDYFDDMEDDEPAKFYERFGCVAVFKNELDEEFQKENRNEAAIPSKTTTTTTTKESTEAAVATAAATKPTEAVKISLEKPLADYKAYMDKMMKTNQNDDGDFELVFVEVRTVLWRLLFDSASLSKENAKKAEELLEQYKLDACFYSPYEYNNWILKVRDELFERKYFDFWRNVIVAKRCGLCDYRDSDYFDDAEDTSSDEFYKSGDKLMLKATHNAPIAVGGGDAVKKPRK